MKINTVDLPEGDILWDPGDPPISATESRTFKYWSDREGGEAYQFGKRMSMDIDLYAQWE